MVAHAKTARKWGKVLVVNSDPEIIRILEVNLVQANVEIVAARSGTEALTKIQNNQTDLIILDPALPDMEGPEIYQRITELSQTHYTPIIIISARLPRKRKITRAVDLPIYHITKPFDPKEVVALVQGYLLNKERTMRTNPLTGLPNRLQIRKEIDRLIRQKKTFTTFFIALHDLEAINKAYGRPGCDRVVQLVAETVSEAVRFFGNADDLVGYFGGDKFVMVSTPWKARGLCRRVIADYDKRIQMLSHEEPLPTGLTDNQGLASNKRPTPVMSIHIALVTNQKRTFCNYLEIAKTAQEQLEYLKRSPVSNCYYDLQVNGNETPLALSHGESVLASQEGAKTIQGALDWFDFLTKEINFPINIMKECLQSLKNIDAAGLTQEHRDSLKALHKHHERLMRVVQSIASLARIDEIGSETAFDEVDIRGVVNRVIDIVQELAKQKQIKVNIEAGEISQILWDKKSLTQCLLYTVRGAIQSAPSGSHLHINLLEEDEEHIRIEINNPGHHVNSRVLNSLFQNQCKTSPQKGIIINELYPARILTRCLGCELQATCEKGKGLTYLFVIPKKWQSWMPEVDTLQLAMDISRKEARDSLKDVNQIIAFLNEKLLAAVKENMEKLGGKIQEMGVLCNRSLFLANDLSSRLESQQNRMLQQEVDQLTVLEAILVPCREIVRNLRLTNVFELDSAKRVARYALSIADEFKISENHRKALLYAALFKDLGLVLSPGDMLAQNVVATVEEAKEVKAHFDPLGKTLATIRFLMPALHIIRYRYERHDGQGGLFGVKGNEIPLGSRILAIADKYDAMISGRWPEGKLSPESAMNKIIEDSGQRFDPHVVNAFFMLWKRNEIESVIKVN
jgi:diguanylate cyclase (GGDEF)-like protein